MYFFFLIPQKQTNFSIKIIVRFVGHPSAAEQANSGVFNPLLKTMKSGIKATNIGIPMMAAKSRREKSQSL